MSILKSKARNYLLLPSISLLLISHLTLLSGADFQPSSAEAQRAVEKGVQSVARQISASPAQSIPVGFILPTGETGKKSGWLKQVVPMPSATVVPDFPQKALEEMQKRFATLLAGNHIDGYFIIYGKDNQLHMTFQEQDGAKKSFVAIYFSRAENGSFKISDFKAN